MKFWPKALDSFPLHCAATVALWTGQVSVARFLLPPQPWMPADAAFAAPVSFAGWSVLFGYSTVVMIYLLRVSMGAAPDPLRRRFEKPQPARSFHMISVCVGVGLSSAFSVACACLAATILAEPALGSAADGAWARTLFMGCLGVVGPAVSAATWVLYARAARQIRPGTQAA